MKVEQVVELKKKDGSGTYFIVKDDKEEEYLCFDSKIKSMSGTEIVDFSTKELNDGRKILNLKKAASGGGGYSRFSASNKAREETMIVAYAKDIAVSFINNKMITSPSEAQECIKLFYNYIKGLINESNKE